MITQLIIDIISVFIAYWLGRVSARDEQTDKLKNLIKKLKEFKESEDEE